MYTRGQIKQIVEHFVPFRGRFQITKTTAATRACATKQQKEPHHLHVPHVFEFVGALAEFVRTC